ncbi:MAG: universal stress protein [Bradymonadia bacterium]
MASINKILVPTDFSDCSAVAFDKATELAGALGAELTLLHIYEPPTYVGDVVVQMPGQEGLTVSEYIRAEARHEMDAFLKEKSLPEGLTVHHRLEPGHHATALKKIAKEEDFDLIVMGTHGRTGLAHALLGSVAEKLIRTADVPVMVVRG